MTKSELKIRAIENGTVIDHINANKALHILKILDLPDDETTNVTVAMNVSSGEIGRKDIVKIENRELDPSELNQVALIAPKATINIIRDFKPIKKDKIVLPKKISSIIKYLGLYLDVFSIYPVSFLTKSFRNNFVSIWYIR